MPACPADLTPHSSNISGFAHLCIRTVIIGGKPAPLCILSAEGLASSSPTWLSTQKVAVVPTFSAIPTPAPLPHALPLSFSSARRLQRFSSFPASTAREHSLTPYPCLVWLSWVLPVSDPSLAGEINETDVEGMDVARKNGKEEEYGVEQRIVAGPACEECDSEWGEEDVQRGDGEAFE